MHMKFLNKEKHIENVYESKKLEFVVDQPLDTISDDQSHLKGPLDEKTIQLAEAEANFYLAAENMNNYK